MKGDILTYFMNRVQQEFYDVRFADSIETACLQLDAKRLVFVDVETWKKK
jgi:hypothetical protein